MVSGETEDHIQETSNNKQTVLEEKPVVKREAFPDVGEKHDPEKKSLKQRRNGEKSRKKKTQIKTKGKKDASKKTRRRRKHSGESRKQKQKGRTKSNSNEIKKSRKRNIKRKEKRRQKNEKGTRNGKTKSNSNKRKKSIKRNIRRKEKRRQKNEISTRKRKSKAKAKKTREGQNKKLIKRRKKGRGKEKRRKRVKKVRKAKDKKTLRGRKARQTNYTECVAKFMSLTKMAIRISINVEKQVRTIDDKFSLVGKKNAKKGEFNGTFDTLLSALGGNKSAPECDGKPITRSDRNKNYKGLYTICFT